MCKSCYECEEEKAICMKHQDLYKNGKAMEVQNQWEHRRTSNHNYSSVCYLQTWMTEDVFFWTIGPIRELVTGVMRKMAFQLCPDVPRQDYIACVFISDIIFSFTWVLHLFKEELISWSRAGAVAPVSCSYSWCHAVSNAVRSAISLIRFPWR